ncbi:Basic region leucine zipper [Musa troglodytarum]|uniref:Basic region leucine zipper n=1 Tax=Musa troglodytarum TaxID=320322 RepID=A0A9E7HFY0_9LILI|nr:Basic region leucine zipper [Musa troglodytarum]URE32467.1 Basic region leucine zipper [Musa troglodytarum]URE32470.1 Basic region leucine zipper [Musa troglodytarum]URE32471.1 Basic region leucine zipper [Musa troglodytarum]
MIPYSSMLSKNTRIMEEVWKDINLSSLQQDMPSTPSLPPNHLEGLCGVSSSTTTSFQSIILQDFLTEHFKATSDRSPPPSTALGLNSNLGGGSNGLSSSSASSVFSDGVGDSVVACCSKKHPLEHELNQESGDRSDVDRRKKRLIKNRESAARSRARKQAYTTELEQEVDHLVNENRTLKRQFEELKKAAQDHLFVPAKHTLQRTLTAPF